MSEAAAEGNDAGAGAKTCKAAKLGLIYYQARARYWAHRMGAEPERRSGVAARGALRPLVGCPRLRLLAKHARQAAHRARLAYERWSYSWEWQRWLPAKFYRVARCETGVRWDWDSGTYVSAFGIIRVAYEQFHHWTGHNTPREQYEVADRIRARYGWSAWGCGGA